MVPENTEDGHGTTSGGACQEESGVTSSREDPEMMKWIPKGRAEQPGTRSRHAPRTALLSWKASVYKGTPGRLVCFSAICTCRKKKKFLRLHLQPLQIKEFRDTCTPKIKQELETPLGLFDSISLSLSVCVYKHDIYIYIIPFLVGKGAFRSWPHLIVI